MEAVVEAAAASGKDHTRRSRPSMAGTGLLCTIGGICFENTPQLWPVSCHDGHGKFVVGTSVP